MNKIDFVMIWVDDSDIEWKKSRNQYADKNSEELADYRYRDWDNLKYWFRGIEKYAPWVNNVYLITCGHYPKWLNLKHPKLRFVKHDEYIPKEYLPTFNSNAIELNFHRIPELEEHFVYFNDDMFLIDNVKETDFFQNGFPKLSARLDAIAMPNEIFGHILLNNIQLIHRHFSKEEILKGNWKKWYYIGYGWKNLIKTFFLSQYCCFPSFYNPHLPVPILKNTMKEIWRIEEAILQRTSMNKFRTIEDVNQYIFSWYEIAKGNFIPRKNIFGKYYSISKENHDIVEAIKKQKYKTICLNDTSNDFDFEKAKHEIIEAFEVILPEKSNFEL